MPSLTLTDPDMILPFDGSERESSTPSPPSQLAYLSNLNTPRYNSNDPHASSGASSTISAGSPGTAVTTNTRPKKNFSRAFSHEDIGVANSRRLSDIGEELSPSRIEEFDKELAQNQKLQQISTQQSQLAPLDTNQPAAANSPTPSAGSARTLKEAGVSPQLTHSASASPVVKEKTPQSQTQDETAKAALPAGDAIASAVVTGKGPGEDFSSAILSSEAERILDNAKKRLTVRQKQ